MKITKRAKEPTAIEKRDASITTFAIFASIPLVLSLLLGFSLGNVTTQNESNFQERLNVLRQENDALRQQVVNLNKTYVKADSIFELFKRKGIRDLEGRLEKIESDFGFNNWERDKNDVIDEFEHAVERVERPMNFKEVEEINQLLDFTKKWLMEYSEAKSEELRTKKLIVKKDMGVSIEQDLQDRIKELESLLDQKNTEIAGMRNTGQITQILKENDLGKQKEDNSQLEEQLGSTLSNNQDVKGRINMKVTEIRDVVLPDIKINTFLGMKMKDKQRLEEVKARIENKLEDIKSLLSELDT